MTIRERLLADALYRVLVELEVLEKNREPSGPELLVATDDWLEHRKEQTKRKKLDKQREKKKLPRLK